MSVAADGSWSCDKPTVLKLGVLPIKAMLAVEEHLWASSGGQVFIISTHTHRVEVRSLALFFLRGFLAVGYLCGVNISSVYLPV